MKSFYQKLIPPWWPRYQKAYVSQDIVAGFVVALLLIPQGLAYATLAGVPPVYGLYASFLPLLCYALLGSSAVLSVGPMAITSLLTASALSGLHLAGPLEMVAAAAALAFMSGLILLLAGFLRLGAIAQLLSHPVVHSFISGAAILIVLGQIKPLLGLSFPGNSAFVIIAGLAKYTAKIETLTASVGVFTLVLLLVTKRYGQICLQGLGLKNNVAAAVLRLTPMFVLLAVMGLVIVFQWQQQLRVVGPLPTQLPQLTIPSVTGDLLSRLWLPALVIGLLGFVESISIAQSFAIRSHQALLPNAELKALGLANMGSGVLQGFPVAGGFSRTLVNAEAGAKSPLAGVFAALFVALALWLVAGWFQFLPISVLAAIIIAAALQLISIKPYLQAWRYDRAEAVAMVGTTLGVLVWGVEVGIAIGVALSVMTVVWRTSQPHIAVVGRVPNTEHFRNVDRHRVETHPSLLMIRVDENLVFANAESVFNHVLDYVADQPECRHVVLLMSSVSRIDVTALEMLLHLQAELERRRINLHLAEVKGPVSDQLQDSEFAQNFSGRLFLSGQHAFEKLRAADR